MARKELDASDAIVMAAVLAGVPQAVFGAAGEGLRARLLLTSHALSDRGMPGDEAVASEALRRVLDYGEVLATVLGVEIAVGAFGLHVPCVPGDVTGILGDRWSGHVGRTVSGDLRAQVAALRAQNHEQRNALTGASLALDAVLSLDTIPQEFRDLLTATVARPLPRGWPLASGVIDPAEIDGRTYSEIRAAVERLTEDDGEVE